MRKDSKPLQKAVIVFLASVLLQLIPLSGGMQEPPAMALESRDVEKMRLVVGKSVIINLPKSIKRISLAAPQIADTVVITPRQFYITAKAVGTTNLTLWGQDDRVFKIFDVEISPDLTILKEKLQEVLSGEDIRVTATHDAITLFGDVSSSISLSQALAIARAFVPPDMSDKVINLLQVAGVHQVMLEVRVAEMSRSLTRRLGFNFSALTNGVEFGLSQLSNLTSLSNAVAPGLPFALDVASNVNAIFRFQKGDVTVTGFIDALKENGLVKILAEPTLVTLSGQEASFLAGGEFPIPVPQQFNVITIKFKEFGVGLRFTPSVLSEDRISLKVAPEVSELDFSNSVVVSGFVVPALTTRRASTVIELADGQSFAIAGLLNETVRETISKYPVLGDIPILGALFRSSSFQKNETELIIIVTPHLVQPLDITTQTLPTDEYIEPNDFLFYLLGNLEGGGRAVSGSAKLDGKFGYIVP